MTALALAVLAVVLAWPAPVLLSRARWVRRAPAAAMALWQAVALAGGLAMIATPLAWGLAPFGSTLLAAIPGAWTVVAEGDWLGLLTADDLAPARIAAVTFSAVLTVHLLLTLSVTSVRTLRERRRHRRLVDLLAAPQDPAPDVAPLLHRGTRVLPHDAPVAYCLPGLTGGLTVVSRGLLDQLTGPEVAAVVAHEKAHVRQRHDLLRLAFEAWHRAFPWLPTTAVARQAVASLTEMLADDAALREHRREDLVSALARTGGADILPEMPRDSRDPAAPTPPVAADGAVPITLRLYRLLSPCPPLPGPLRLGILAAALAVALIPPALLVTG